MFRRWVIEAHKPGPSEHCVLRLGLQGGIPGRQKPYRQAALIVAPGFESWMHLLEGHPGMQATPFKNLLA